MAGIVFHFEENDADVYSGRLIDLDAWRYACKACGLYKMRMIDLMPGGTDVKLRDEEMDFKKVASLEEFEEQHQNDVKLYFETPWTFPDDMNPTELNQLVHPADNVWYIFGPSNGFRPQKDDGRQWVTIEQEGFGAMHSVHCAILALHDRFAKLKGLR